MFSWFLLKLGLNLILACRSWSQIWVSGLGRNRCDEWLLINKKNDISGGRR